MRTFLMLGCATALSACGGGTGPQTVGNAAPPAPTGGATTPAPTPASFINPAESKTYEGLGSVHSYAYHTDSNKNGQSGQLYAGDATTARDGGISITYNPRDAIFELTITRDKGIVNFANRRFQDPAHRTDFDGLREPQAGVPELAAAKQIQYLQFGSSSGPLRDPADPTYPIESDYRVGGVGYASDTSTFFYQKPGTTTKYVSYAGFVRNAFATAEITDPGTTTPYLRQNYTLERAAFVYGERTGNSAVPRTGSATFTGDMLATLVFNPRFDDHVAASTYFQWIDGSHSTAIDFGSLAVTHSFTGRVTAPTIDAYTDGNFDLPAGSIFTAAATSRIDLINKGGFTGSFGSASFTRPGMSNFVVAIAGSSIDGAFFGPAADEIGGGFRIVGGTPDERIDILGAYTGKK